MSRNKKPQPTRRIPVNFWVQQKEMNMLSLVCQWHRFPSSPFGLVASQSRLHGATALWAMSDQTVPAMYCTRDGAEPVTLRLMHRSTLLNDLVATVEFAEDKHDFVLLLNRLSLACVAMPGAKDDQHIEALLISNKPEHYPSPALLKKWRKFL